MMRTSLPSFLSIAALFATACGTTEPPGDVQYGEYIVEATLRDGGCDLQPGADDRTAFEFWARVGADVDGTAYLTVEQPPGNVEQRPRRGDVTGDGTLVFDTSEYQDVSGCDCLISVDETITLVPVTGTDGGPSDGGVDGGPPDAGVPDGGGTIPEVPGLPPPNAVTAVSGSIEYQMESGGNCPSPKTDADGGIVSGCQLPCTFFYDLAGDRQQ